MVAAVAVTPVVAAFHCHVGRAVREKIAGYGGCGGWTMKLESALCRTADPESLGCDGN